MKKIIPVMFTAALIIMIPALFIAYLYNNGANISNPSLTNKMKIETISAKKETGLRLGQMSFLKA